MQWLGRADPADTPQGAYGNRRYPEPYPRAACPVPEGCAATSPNHDSLNRQRHHNYVSLEHTIL